MKLDSNLINWNYQNQNNNNIDNILQNIKYDLSSVKVISLNNGIFDNSSIFHIANFILANLEILDLGSNDFNSLSFVNNLELLC